ncbi:U-box domain-containing protein 35-like [Aristolochia californica]|uniref:U-box domain-containing protein 35-like n=1 Tax=Aristolochia californica TaxID=171875 RepID=UPI0035DFC776
MGSYNQSAEERLPVIRTTAVAIDRNKNSQHAVKWAVDHLLLNNPNIILIHVRNKNAIAPSFSMTETNADANSEQIEAEMQQLYLPFRGFCARKGVTVTEVVLEDTDVSKAIVDYINSSCLHNVVVGASGRNAFIRKFKNLDVPSTLGRTAPDFCTVYVIAKGKVMTVRSASRPVPAPAPRPAPTPAPPPPVAPSQFEADDVVKTPFARGMAAPAAAAAAAASSAVASWRGPAPVYLDRRNPDRLSDFTKTPSRPQPSLRNAPPGGGGGGGGGVDMDAFLRSARTPYGRDSISDSLDFPSYSGFQSADFSAEGLDFSITSSDSPRSSFSIQSMKDVEAEMKRLKRELKNTMDLYSTAMQEAVSAKQKANQYHQWKMEEARKFEEARMAEEAALAIAEVEKVKCRAAIEAAEAAQRLAEMEAQRRKNAEMKAKLAAEEKKKALDALNNNDVRYRKYTIEEIEVATNFFAESLKIGEGGYGPVYGATLDHTPVAIKVLRPDAAQGRKQFQQEVEILSCIRHPNMVLLLGACPEYGCLVYEYMDYGSLDDRLFRRGNSPPIPWRIRFKIAAEIATGLLFLHQAKPEPLVHRDLKPANILLDRNYVSKISDVGLARLVPPSVADSVTQYRMTSTAGTFCYIDPEYQQTGMLGIKSDIYSLGIMLLQIITAKPPMGLTHHVERAIDKGTFAEMLDHTVPDWPVEEALGYAKLALKCAELRRKDRPDLVTVVLPELNRLRKLGNGYEDINLSLNGGTFSAGGSGYVTGARSGTPPSNPRSRQGISSPLQGNSQYRSSSTDDGGARIPNGYSSGGRLVPRRMVP